MIAISHLVLTRLLILSEIRKGNLPRGTSSNSFLRIYVRCFQETAPLLRVQHCTHYTENIPCLPRLMVPVYSRAL